MRMELECDENYNLCSGTNNGVTKIMEVKDHEKESKSLSHLIEEVNNEVLLSNDNQLDSTTLTKKETSNIETTQDDEQDKEIVTNGQEETVVDIEESEKTTTNTIDTLPNNLESNNDNYCEEIGKQEEEEEEPMDTTTTTSSTFTVQEKETDCQIELGESLLSTTIVEEPTVEVIEEKEVENQNNTDNKQKDKDERQKEEESMEIDDTSIQATESTSTTTAATTTIAAVEITEKEKKEKEKKEKKKIIIENPGNIFMWRESISENRKTTQVDTIVNRQLDFFCEAAEQSDSYLVSLETFPTKFITYHCIKAMHLSLDNLFTRAINMIWKLKALLQLYPMELEQQNYDIEGFHYLLDSTIHHIMTDKNKVKDDEDDEDDETKDDILIEEFDSNNERWNELSLKSQSMILASKLYYLMLVNQPLKELKVLSNQVIETCQDVAEFFCMDCKIKSRKRKESSLPILKPKKLEMQSLLKAIELEPANPLVWTLMLETLFDFMRTDDRRPKIIILGKCLETVDHIQCFFHEEFQELLKNETCITKFLLLDVYTLGANFYGYRNLRKEAVWKLDKRKSLSKNVQDAKEYIRKNYQTNLLNALAIHPNSWKVNLSLAFNHLRKFERDKALKTLELGLQEDPLNVTLVLVYIRTLIGGNSDQLTQAFNNITEAIQISSKYEWPLLAQTHLYFLLGCVSWMNGNLDGCLSNWMQGFHLSKPHFLSQFFFWSKNQIRKYLWPETFTNFEVVENLKIQLRNLEVDSLIDDETREASTAFLNEIEELFPLTSGINKELRKLKKKWYYLFDLPNQDSDSDDSEDEESSVDVDEVKIVEESVEVIDLHSDNEDMEEIVNDLYSDILEENVQEVIDLDSDEEIVEEQEEESYVEEPIKISFQQVPEQLLQPSFDADMEIEVSQPDSIPIITLDDESEDDEMNHPLENEYTNNHDEEQQEENMIDEDDDDVVEVEKSGNVIQLDEEANLNDQNVQSDEVLDNEESEQDVCIQNNNEEDNKNGHNISEEVEERISNVVDEEVVEKPVIISHLINSSEEPIEMEESTINHSDDSTNNNSKVEGEREADELEEVVENASIVTM